MTAPLQLPVPLATASGWQLYDYREVSLTSLPAGADGTATATGPQLDPGVLWLIDHGVADCDSTTTTELRLYSGMVGRRFLLDGTGSGNFSVADWPNGLQLGPSRSLVAVWSGATTGATGVLTLQLRELRQVTR